MCSRSIVWAKSAGSSAVACSLGDIGPGGGLVFLVSDGLCYEMAPKTWSGSSQDPLIRWCSDSGNSVATSMDIGAGRTNTEAMLTDAAPFVACISGAADEAVAYNGGGLDDWFLPSSGETNAMCNYSRNPASPRSPSEACAGVNETFQTADFAASAYGFSDGRSYWASSQYNDLPGRWQYAYNQQFGSAGGQLNMGGKSATMFVRPIRTYVSPA